MAMDEAPTGRNVGFAGVLRFGLRFAAMLGAVILCVPLHGLWRLFGRPSPWPRIFLYLISRCYGARVTVEGPRIDQDVFYVCNHLSWCDIPIIAGKTGCAFVAKAEIADTLFLRFLCNLNNTIFVRREDRLGVGMQIESLRAVVEQHQPVTVFPEGTTTDGGSLLPFKRSLFAVLAPPPRAMLVQPMLIDFADAGPDIAWIGEESFESNAWRLMTRKGPLPVRLEFLEPFDPAECSDRKEIAEKAESRIRAALAASLERREHV